MRNRKKEMYNIFDSSIDKMQCSLWLHHFHIIRCPRTSLLRQSLVSTLGSFFTTSTSSKLLTDFFNSLSSCIYLSETMHSFENTPFNLHQTNGYSMIDFLFCLFFIIKSYKSCFWSRQKTAICVLIEFIVFCAFLQ